MLFSRIISVLLVFVALVSCRTMYGPEKVARKFAKAISAGDFEQASSYTILKAKKEMDELNRPGKKEDIYIEIVSCSTQATEYGVDCSCLTVMEDREMILIFSMTEVDGEWMIYHLDSERPSQQINTNGNKSTPSPEASIRKFVDYSARGKDKKALNLAILDGKLQLGKELENPATRPVKVNSVQCMSGYRESITCVCELDMENGEQSKYSYEMTLVKGVWRIADVRSGTGPEIIIEEFVNALANGDCDIAKKVSTGNAKETVQGLMDAGCEPFETEIKKVFCEISGNTAVCSCTEDRVGAEWTFNYDMIQIEGVWYVSNYEKDLGIDLGSETEETVEEVDMDSFEEMEYEEEMPVIVNEPFFPGGEDVMYQFISDNLIYPETAKKNGEEGTVYIQFVVQEDGSLYDVKVIKGVSEALDEAAVNVIKNMPNWIPGTENEIPVPVRYTIPIKFKLKG